MGSAPGPWGLDEHRGPVGVVTCNLDAQELLWWPSDRAHADEGEKWDDNSCRMAGLQPKVPT